MDHGPYTSFMRDEHHPSGGMMQMTEEWGDMPSHWMTYFAVEDVDAAAEQVEALGGRVCVPPTDIPDVGRFAVIDDPQGATFSIMHLVERS
jgi:predicted enzyme related to lactoylglutathione lyase